MTDIIPPSALVQCWLGRPAIDAEIVAMEGQMERTREHVAENPLGRGGAVFSVEPASYDAEMSPRA